MSTIFKTTALAFATSSLLIAGCGGSSSDGGSAPRVEPTGKVIDFYVKNATVTFNDCGGGATTTTDATGGFNFPENCFKSGITVTGGTDIGTGLPFNGVMHALAIPGASEIIVSPITTLVYYSGDLGNTAAFAKQLGLENQNFLLIDPMTNKDVLTATVVTQQLLNQIQEVLAKLGINDPSIVAEAANKALSAQMANRIANNAEGSGLTNTDFIQSVIEGSVHNAKASLSTELQANISAVAKNTAAISAAIIQQKVQAVSTAMQNVEIKANPAETLAALNSQIAIIKDASLSKAAPEALDAILGLITNPAAEAALEKLGEAIASRDAAAIESTATALGLPARVIAGLKNIEAYQDFIQLVGAGFNGNLQYSVDQLTKSAANNAPLTVAGGFNSVQLDIKQVGQGNFSKAKVGLSYTINKNTLDIVVSEVDLGFNAAGKLTSASVPSSATYAFKTAGAQTTSVEGANLNIDGLTVSNDGKLNLSVNVFLNKISGQEPALRGAIASYTPKAGDTVSIKVSMGANNNSLRVGTDVNGKPAPSVTIYGGASSLLGQGVNAQLAIQ